MLLRPTARYVLPEFTERTTNGTRTLDPYSKLLAERIVFLGTPVDDTAATDLIAQFMYLEHDAPDRPISLYINSPGGSFGAMSAIYDTMQYLACEVETYCLGQAGSCASALLAAGRSRPHGTHCPAPESSCSSPSSPSRFRASRPICRSRHRNWSGSAK